MLMIWTARQIKIVMNHQSGILPQSLKVTWPEISPSAMCLMLSACEGFQSHVMNDVKSVMKSAHGCIYMIYKPLPQAEMHTEL